MPVVVTGASGLIGMAAGRAFAASSPEVRAFVRRSEVAPELRELGAKVAVASMEDVASVLAAADDRSQATSGTWGLQGPDQVTADELADLLAGRRRRKLHLSGSAALRAGRLTGRRVSPVELEVLEADCLADAPDAATEFGVRRTTLRDGLARSLP